MFISNASSYICMGYLELYIFSFWQVTFLIWSHAGCHHVKLAWLSYYLETFWMISSDETSHRNAKTYIPLRSSAIFLYFMRCDCEYLRVLVWKGCLIELRAITLPCYPTCHLFCFSFQIVVLYKYKYIINVMLHNLK